MANTKEFFLTVARRIFSNWSALKLVVEHGMGTREQAEGFCPYVVEIIYMNDNLNSKEIALELEFYMDDEFDTELQDNSALEIAEELLRFHRYCAEGKEAVAAEELEKLPPLQPWFVSGQPPRSAVPSESAEGVDSDSSKGEEDGGMEVDEPEWTEVKTKRRR